MVPGAADGSLEGVARKPLTVDFHEPGFVSKLAAENQFAPWFQLSGEERQQAGSPWGPANPQAFNRYSYVLNRPIRYADPTGHSAYMNHAQAAEFAAPLRSLAWYLDLPFKLAVGSITLEGIGLKSAGLVREFVKNGVTQILRLMAERGLITTLSAAAVAGPALEAIIAGAAIEMHLLANRLNEFADIIDSLNGDNGVIIGSDCGWVTCDISVINRDNYKGVTWSSSLLTAKIAGIAGGDYAVGRACEIGGGSISGVHWSQDTRFCH